MAIIFESYVQMAWVRFWVLMVHNLPIMHRTIHNLRIKTYPLWLSTPLSTACGYTLLLQLNKDTTVNIVCGLLLVPGAYHIKQ